MPAIGGETYVQKVNLSIPLGKGGSRIVCPCIYLPGRTSGRPICVSLVQGRIDIEACSTAGRRPVIAVCSPFTFLRIRLILCPSCDLDEICGSRGTLEI